MGTSTPAKRGATTTTVIKQKATRVAYPQTTKTSQAVVPRALVHQVCGLTDPFCLHAVGAKYPDSSRVRTLTYPYRQVMTFSTNGLGRIAALFVPNYFRDALTPMADVSPNTATWTPAGIAPVIPDVVGYRIVSCGLRVRRIVAPLYASGTVHIRVLGAQAALGVSDVDVLSFARSECIDIALQDCKETIIAGTRSAQMPQNFYSGTDPGTDPLLYTPSGFQPITVFVDGAPINTPVITIEYIIHYELTFDDNSGTALLATPPPQSNPMVTAVSSKLSSVGKSIFVSGLESFSKYVVSAASGAIATYLGGPGAGRAIGGMTYSVIKDVD